jgi:hypothetical protein
MKIILTLLSLKMHSLLKVPECQETSYPEKSQILHHKTLPSYIQTIYKL